MGADIHWVIERRVGSKWIGVLTDDGPKPARNLDDVDYYKRYAVFDHRNYNFFANLAGVRGEGPEPRGVPDDASETTQVLVEGWDCDGHSHSWCSLRDFMLAWLKTLDVPLVTEYLDARATGDTTACNQILTNLAGVYELDGDEENYRVVFWFDN